MKTLVESQRTFFNTNQTRDVNFRILQLKKLYRAIKDNEALITEALYKDLSKSPAETYSTEIGLVLHEISYVIKHLKKWTKPRRKIADLHLLPARFIIYTEPLGVSLVMSTWNYPILLSLDPIISSIAAGNTVILKTSEYAVATNNVLKTMLEKTFNRSYLAVVQGGYTENHALLEQHFDFIFFTGSQNVGKIVMSSAARFLTPVCLELGGKSPCIVDSSANLEIAARRIVWGKFLNAGQTCVAPDYILVDKGVKDRLIELMKLEIQRQFGDKPLENKDYPKIINERRFVHLSTLCPKAEMDFVTNKISPTIMDLGDMNGREASESEIMQEEIFGPLLPVLSFDNINTVMAYVASRPVPLSLYIFSTNSDNCRRVTQELRFGGGCINDVVFHLASSKAPFGGAGESGMGGYHGIYGLRTFSHEKSVLVQSPKTDLNIRYAPCTDKKLRLLKKVLR
ncbi:MAG: aldehyde dehydrogenase family protein [Treponema sp.]|nr:aldehyde dehydrogenase family protein [Treponema sp.]